MRELNQPHVGGRLACPHYGTGLKGDKICRGPSTSCNVALGLHVDLDQLKDEVAP